MEHVTRRDALKAAGIALGVSQFGTVQAQTSSTDSWPTFSYDTQNSGHSPTQGPKRDIFEQWSFETGGAVRSSPVVVDGSVYVGSDDGSVYAIDQGSGNLVWEFETGDSVVGSPAVADGTVYVGSSDAFLYALDASTGDQQWSFETGGGIAAAPTVSNDTVYIGSDDGSMYAIDTSSGTTSWTVDTGSLVSSTPAIVDGTVYFGSADNRLYAVDAVSGDTQWTFEARNGINSAPAVVDGRVYVTSNDGYLYALDAATSDQLWSFPLDGLGGTSPAVTDDAVFVTEGVSGTRIHAVDITTGEQIWSGETGDSVRPSPAVADEMVYFGSSDGYVYAVTTGDGTLRWRFNTGAVVTSSPAVVGDTLYIGSNDRRVYALTGSVQQNPTSTTTTSPPDESEPGNASVGGDGGTSTVGPNSDTSGNEGIPILPVMLGVVGASVGGGGVWWMYNRSGTDDDEDGDQPHTSSTSASDEAPTADRTTSEPASVKDQLLVTDWLGDEERREPKARSRRWDISVDYEALGEETPIDGKEDAEVTRTTVSSPDGPRTLAIKRPHLSGTLHAETFDRLLTEAEAWGKIDDHNHIVDLVDYGSQPLPWVAMEYMDGGTLKDKRDEMSPLQSLWTAVAITKGVYHAHRRGVSHIHLKPENVLFQTVENAWDIPKVSDWWLRPEYSNNDEPESDVLPYLAPEQLDQSYGQTDDITDVYQLGALFYEMFTSETHIDITERDGREAVLNADPTPPSELAAVPPELDDVLLTALATEKSDRYDSVVYLRDSLTDLYRDS